MNILFLDFDGVVNTPMWELTEEGTFHCSYGYAADNKVNNYQSVQWVSEFCQKYNYSIVVTSTWRRQGLEKCTEFLINGGLRDDVQVIGITPYLHKERGYEISAWLDEHENVSQYIILDDDSDMTVHMDRLVLCKPEIGFSLLEFKQAEDLHNKLMPEK